MRVIGLYSDLANTTLEPAASIYEKPKNFFQKNKHPDLYYVNSNYFDLEGEKNEKKNNFKKKYHWNVRDSMIENYEVNSKFDF